MLINFHHSREDTPNIRTFFFEPEKPVAYTAGQFIELTLPHNNPDSRGIKRWFTLSSSPAHNLISITTKIAPENGSSFKNALQVLKPGDELTISDPMGDFVLPKIMQTPLVFVALGIGITPFLSILQWLADTGESRPIRLLHAISSEDEITFQDVFERTNQHVTYIVSKPSASWGGERGHVTAEMILGLEEPDNYTLVYISGPEAVVERLNKDLQTAGLNKNQIVGDYFPGYDTSK